MLAIILAGGSGSRLWPLSREQYPKQLLTLERERSLLQETRARLKGLVAAEDIVTVTSIRYLHEVRLQLQELGGPVTMLAEPLARDTAPAIAAALMYLQRCRGDDTVLILPSDHLIRDTVGFARTVMAAAAAVAQDLIVAFGIRPSYPETGYGYIRALPDAALSGALRVERFVEKPPPEIAQSYLDSGEYYWNGGMFMGHISVLLGELRLHAPHIHALASQLDFAGVPELAYGVYEQMPAISIDYAVMEHSRRMALVELQSDWNDLGSWQSIHAVMPKDENGNVLMGRVLTHQVSNSLIYSQKELVAAAGLDGVVVVETEDAILACGMHEAQQVRQIYARLCAEQSEVALVHKTVLRPWGYYTCLSRGEDYLTKLLCVLPRHRLSYQSHAYRSEHWVVLSGEARIIRDGREYRIYPGDSFDIPQGACHALYNPGDEELRIIEVQRGELISEEDIIRYDDDYGRC